MDALIVDQCGWGKVRVTGTDRARFLHGMCTANIETLAVDSWLRAAILTIKGRVTAVCEVVNRGDDLLLLCEPALTDKILGLLEKHAIMDDVAFEVVQLPLHRRWTDGSSVWQAPPIFEEPEGAADPSQVEGLRIVAGMPRYGVDLDESNFPFESLLGQHVDYEKGCYLGQEPVYRVFSQGKAARELRGLIVQGDGAVAVGASIDHVDRTGAGRVSSSAVVPGLGSIALGYVHRTVNQPGTEVSVAGRSAEIVSLPFQEQG